MQSGLKRSFPALAANLTNVLAPHYLFFKHRPSQSVLFESSQYGSMNFGSCIFFSFFQRITEQVASGFLDGTSARCADYYF